MTTRVSDDVVSGVVCRDEVKKMPDGVVVEWVGTLLLL